MSIRSNPQQLVLRIDTASGTARVGWAAEMPLGRFTHVDTICEADCCRPISKTSPLWSAYLEACNRATDLNRKFILQQEQENLAKNWLPVPLDLHSLQTGKEPDEFGNFQTLAMQTFFRLTGNHASVWAVIHDQRVTHIQSQNPPREMEELEYQVWLHHTLFKLDNCQGETLRGSLVVQASGLWFIPC